MTRINLSSKLEPVDRGFALGLVAHVLDRCDPSTLIRDHFQLDAPPRPTHILAFGKASSPMALACAQMLGPWLRGGVILSPDALIPIPSPDIPLRFLGVDHPSPTARNVEATKALAEYARSIPNSDRCMVCISGGGSAHLCLPNDGVSLQYIIDVTKNHINHGSSIHKLNQSRRSLEQLKAGGLAKILSHVHDVQALVLSDVLGDDLEIIASGPMVNAEHPTVHTIVGNHETTLAAAVEFLVKRKILIGHQESQVAGDAQTHGRRLAGLFMEGSGAVLMAGETTVDARASGGVGGPCIEMALACALELVELGSRNWGIIGLATDGIDGPSLVAGAVITGPMLVTDQIKQSARRALAEHNTRPFLDSIGALITTGPTGTNLNDVYLVYPLDTNPIEK